jgi:hypothetical protein
MSFALAKALSEKLRGESIDRKNINFSSIIEFNKDNHSFNNLNSPLKKEFNNPPKRKMDSKFRRHILKGGNMTIDLLNYNLTDSSIPISTQWNIYVYSGTGGKFSKELIPKNIYKNIESFIMPEYNSFISEVKKLCVNIPEKKKLPSYDFSNVKQKLYELGYNIKASNDKITINFTSQDEIDAFLSHFRN